MPTGEERRRVKPDDGITQIRFKYKYNYTWKDKKYTNRKQYRHTQIQILPLALLARSEEEKY